MSGRTADAGSRSAEDTRLLASVRKLMAATARGAPSHVLAELVADEVLKLLDCDSCALWAYEDDGIVMVGSRAAPGRRRFTRGTRLASEDMVVTAEVRRTGNAVHVANYSSRAGGGPRRVAELGLNSVIAAPVMVGGELWGALTAGSGDPERLPPGSEDRLEVFAGLCGVAVASVESSARLESHAAEQEASLAVARTALEYSDEEGVFETIVREAVRVLGLSSAALIRFARDGSHEVLAARHVDGNPGGDDDVAGMVLQRGAVVSVGDPDPTAPEDARRALGHPVGFGAPLEIDGRTWGAVVVGGGRGRPIPANAAQRLGHLADISELAVAHLEARHALADRAAEVEKLAAARRFLLVEALQGEDRLRRRIGDALHDDVLQELYAARQDLAEVKGSDPALDRARVAVATAGRHLRDAVRDLHPAVSWTRDLEARLRAVLEQGRERAGFEPLLEVDGGTSGAFDDLLLAVARELVQNIVKHADATRVTVAVHDEDGASVMEVTDNGLGMAPERPSEALRSGHIGLASARERVEAIGGSFDLASAPGAGTRVRISVPRGVVGDPSGQRG